MIPSRPFGRYILARRFQILTTLFIIIIFTAFILTIKHYRQLNRDALLAETFKNMKTMKENIDFIETANLVVKQQIENLKNSVNQIKNTLENANSSLERH